MSSGPSARAYLAAILDSIGNVENHVVGLERDRLEGDTMARDAVERCIERIGEALARVGDRDRDLSRDLPAGSVRDVAERLHRATARVGIASVWNLVGQDLPALKLSAALRLDRLGGGKGDG